MGGETSAKQVFDRLAGTWAYWGWKGGYFDSEKDAAAFFDEVRFMLAAQVAAPTHLSGSIRASTGLTALMARARATITSITALVSCNVPNPLTSTATSRLLHSIGR